MLDSECHLRHNGVVQVLQGFLECLPIPHKTHFQGNRTPGSIFLYAKHVEIQFQCQVHALGVRASSPQRKRQAGKMPALPGVKKETGTRNPPRGCDAVRRGALLSPPWRGAEAGGVGFPSERARTRPPPKGTAELRFPTNCRLAERRRLGAPSLGVRASSPQRKRQAGKMPALPGERKTGGYQSRSCPPSSHGYRTQSAEGARLYPHYD